MSDIFVAFNLARGRELASRVFKADTPYARARGLLGRESLTPGEGLWIAPCAMVHTLGMRFTIDVLFLDADLKILRAATLKPWRVSPWVWGACSVLELEAGASAGAAPGDRLEMRS